MDRNSAPNSGAIPRPPRVLAIAASDSSGAAGLQADLKTFTARGVYGLSAVTAITAQDSVGIKAIQTVQIPFISAQIAAVVNDIGVDAVKTGLLPGAPLIEAVSLALLDNVPCLVVDPVLVTGAGLRFADDTHVKAYRDELFPYARIITPNLDEAAILLGVEKTTLYAPEALREAARRLRQETGAAAVLIKGGHLPGNLMIDVLCDGDTLYDYVGERLPIENPRGTGCTFAACITAELAKGHPLPEAVQTAKDYLAAALRAAIGWRMGQGRGTVWHAVRPESN